MNIIEKLKWRYATKKFDSRKKISDSKLTILKEAFNLTALSYGLQTLKLVIIEDKTIRETLVAASYGQRQVVDASHLLVVCIQDTIGSSDVESHFENVQEIRNTSDAILDPYKEQLKKTVKAMSKTELHIWSTNQAYIALGNLMTVCAAEDIDSCPMEGFIPENVDDQIGLGKLGLRSVLLLPVGYRAEDDMFAKLEKVRKPLSETVIEI
ncbi:MAG: NAD(P)H-dependent oxidoreductase [Winogradskyella sp.]|nr:NAD(P)H-dependent oxidoreductase [Winogradskyella sp.]